METGRNFMTQPTSNSNNNTPTGKRLSVQVSLSGLSFLISSNRGREVLLYDTIPYTTSPSPEDLLSDIESFLKSDNLSKHDVDDVCVIYATNMYALVPTPLFEPEKASEYLKFNNKILATDYIAYEALSDQDITVVYIPYVNVNNYFFDTFGSFSYFHSTTLLLDALWPIVRFSSQAEVYIHVQKEALDCIAMKNGSLQLCNTFPYKSPEDFVYYVLFLLEQLSLDPNTVKVRVFGSISETADTYTLLYRYVNNLNLLDTSRFSLPDFPSEESPHQNFLLKTSL
ncbi:DUF3822 family protein [Flavobacteriaceae bacterium TK19130]|nr:DUF3822 family protein [Thermobacterium salinum]